MKRSVKITFFTIAFIAFAGVLTGLYFFNKKHKDLKNVKPHFVISAEVLLQEFVSDETGSTAKYSGRIIEVSGIVQAIKKGEENTYSIILSTGNDFSSVICTLPPNNESINITPGTKITVKGECSGFLMDVLLNNCVLVE